MCATLSRFENFELPCVGFSGGSSSRATRVVTPPGLLKCHSAFIHLSVAQLSGYRWLKFHVQTQAALMSQMVIQQYV